MDRCLPPQKTNPEAVKLNPPREGDITVSYSVHLHLPLKKVKHISRRVANMFSITTELETRQIKSHDAIRSIKYKTKQIKCK